MGVDLILIDCPPNLYQCTWNALLASNFVVIPVLPEGIGIASATFEIVGLPPLRHTRSDRARPEAG